MYTDYIDISFLNLQKKTSQVAGPVRSKSSGKININLLPAVLHIL